MRLLTLIFCALVSIGLLSCGGSESEVVADNPVAESPAGTESPSSNTVEDLPWTFLVNGIYHNGATIGGGGTVQNNPNKGRWIDFKENGTYEYGLHDTKEYEGNWFYDEKTDILELTPKGNHRPSEWRVMHKEDNLIWMGTAKYGNNAVQMQWLRREGYPSK